MLQVGDSCPTCGWELVAISRKTLRAMQRLRPVINSIPRSVLKQKLETYTICPRCDAYALGIELLSPFPFTYKDGRTATVDDLDLYGVTREDHA